MVIVSVLLTLIFKIFVKKNNKVTCHCLVINNCPFSWVSSFTDLFRKAMKKIENERKRLAADYTIFHPVSSTALVEKIR